MQKCLCGASFLDVCEWVCECICKRSQICEHHFCVHSGVFADLRAFTNPLANVAPKTDLIPSNQSAGFKLSGGNCSITKPSPVHRNSSKMPSAASKTRTIIDILKAITGMNCQKVHLTILRGHPSPRGTVTIGIRKIPSQASGVIIYCPGMSWHLFLLPSLAFCPSVTGIPKTGSHENVT